MKTYLLLLVSLIAPVSVAAQAWAGLPFGTSAAHVRDILSRYPPVCNSSANGDDHDCTALVMEALPGDSGDYTVKPQLELWLSSLNTPLYFRTLMHFFNADRQLVRVDLILDTEKYKAEGKQGSDLVDFVSEPVLGELLGKYGTPLEMSAACEPAESRRLMQTHADVIDCNVLWKSGSQTVNLAWKYLAATKAYSLTVRYAVLQNSL